MAMKKRIPTKRPTTKGSTANKRPSNGAKTNAAKPSAAAPQQPAKSPGESAVSASAGAFPANAASTSRPTIEAIAAHAARHPLPTMTIDNEPYVRGGAWLLWRIDPGEAPQAELLELAVRDGEVTWGSLGALADGGEGLPWYVDSLKGGPWSWTPLTRHMQPANGNRVTPAPRAATRGDRRALVHAIVCNVKPAERAAFLDALRAAAMAPDDDARREARCDLNLGPYAHHAGAALHLYGCDVAEIDAPVALHPTDSAEFAVDLDASAALLKARTGAPPSTDSLSVLRDIGDQCLRGCSGDLALALIAAERVFRGDDDEQTPDMKADALASVAAHLADDLNNAAKRYSEAFAERAAARRNDPPQRVQMAESEHRIARRELARIGALAGRLAAALDDVNETADEAAEAALGGVSGSA